MDALFTERETILAAFWMTLRLTAVSALGSLVLGTVLTGMRVSPLPVLRTASQVYVTVARNTWFLQSLVALVVGLIVLAFAGGWLWQHWRSEPSEADQATAAKDPAPEPLTIPAGAPVGERTAGTGRTDHTEEAR